MASINGVQIKGVKTFVGMEGPATQGTVWLNGKKLGFWSQDGDGGCDRFQFNESLLEKAVKSYKKAHKSPDFFNASCLLWELLQLMELEKAYKKRAKKNYPGLLVATDGVQTAVMGVNSADRKLIESSTLYKKFVDDCEKEFGKECTITIYTSIADFDVVTE